MAVWYPLAVIALSILIRQLRRHVPSSTTRLTSKVYVIASVDFSPLDCKRLPRITLDAPGSKVRVWMRKAISSVSLAKRRISQAGNAKRQFAGIGRSCASTFGIQFEREAIFNFHQRRGLDGWGLSLNWHKAMLGLF